MATERVLRTLVAVSNLLSNGCGFSVCNRSLAVLVDSVHALDAVRALPDLELGLLLPLASPHLVTDVRYEHAERHLDVERLHCFTLLQRTAQL